MGSLNDNGTIHAGIGGMNMAPPGPGTMNNDTGRGGMPMMRHHHMMMHMTFFWGKNVELLFSGWPGYNNLGMYMLALVVVFILAFLVEWLSAYKHKFIKESSNRVAAGLLQTLGHGIRVSLAYMVMLAVMSFNAGAFLVAIIGHVSGFFFFGSRAFEMPPGETSDLRPMSC